MNLNERKRQMLKKPKKKPEKDTDGKALHGKIRRLDVQMGEEQRKGLSELVGDWASWVYILIHSIFLISTRTRIRIKLDENLGLQEILLWASWVYI
jgi:hypothetical protein